MAIQRPLAGSNYLSRYERWHVKLHTLPVGLISLKRNVSSIDSDIIYFKHGRSLIISVQNQTGLKTYLMCFGSICRVHGRPFVTVTATWAQLKPVYSVQCWVMVTR